MKLPKTPPFRLDGRRALVTGGSRGIGLAAAAALAEAGASVTVTSRTLADAEQVVAAIRSQGGQGDALALDVMDPGIAQLIENAQPFDVLVNNAGIARHAPFLEVLPDEYDAVMNVNARGAFFVAQAVARTLIRYDKAGSIINISSQMGRVGGPNRSVYCASKFAMEGMTRAMAIELGKYKIRVNTICPTFIETPLTKSTLDNPDLREWILNKIQLGRLGRLDEVMGAILYLASDAASLVTGSSLMLDGGWTAG